jgi:DnaJ-class molecular chaperone
MSHYEVLGVLPSASQDEIRVAYRMRAREVHPDTAAGLRSDTSARMANIAEAWRVLSDATLRRAYDSELTTRVAQPVRDTQEQVMYVPAARGLFPVANDWSHGGGKHCTRIAVECSFWPCGANRS